MDEKCDDEKTRRLCSAFWSIDRTLGTPIHRQIYLAIRGYILDRRLPPRAKLPPTRELAKQLGVGRNTIVAAYDQLTGEGFVEARPGSSTKVAERIENRASQSLPVLRRAVPASRRGAG